MAKKFSQLDDGLISFIERQPIFFTASSAGDGRVNVSPRSTSNFRVIDQHNVFYLDLSGSGNETAAHARAGGQATIMFCAFDGPPRILRLYGRFETVHRHSREHGAFIEQFFDGEVPLGTRQIMKLKFDLVITSCGFGVPLFDFVGERDSMEKCLTNLGPEAIENGWREKNVISLDGLPTGLFDELVEK